MRLIIQDQFDLRGSMSDWQRFPVFEDNGVVPATGAKIPVALTGVTVHAAPIYLYMFTGLVYSSCCPFGGLHPLFA